jgi:holin-like protein
MTANNLLSGFAILLILQFACTWLVGMLHISFPGPLLGMVVLAVLLLLKVIKVEQVEPICTLLMEKLSLFFVPVTVSSITLLELLKKEALPLLATIFVSTAIIIVVTGLFLQFLLKLKGVKKDA